jgi:hypothetical protein
MDRAVIGVRPPPDSVTPERIEHLDRWIAAHGPLSPHAAAVVGLGLCARLSVMTDAEMRQLLPTLRTSAIVRTHDGRWQWRPGTTPPGAGIPDPPAPRVRRSHPFRRKRPPDDHALVERIGTVLFESVSGQALRDRFPDEADVRTALRRLRPDLSPAFVNVIAGAASPRPDSRSSIDRLARNLRTVLGADNPPLRALVGRRLTVAGIVLLGVLAALWIRSSREADRPGSNGLTARETMLNEIGLEQAHYLAVADEHTLSLQELQALERLWRTRVEARDPRTLFNVMTQAWVRFLRGDSLSGEQLLVSAPTSLAHSLGDSHPYARLASLQLATVLQARGATGEAAQHRAAAQRGLDKLVANESALRGIPTGSNPGAMPSPFSLLAHVAPNRPEDEGFRRAERGGYLVALTSMQRWLAERDGWWLAVRAGGACWVAVDTGRNARRLGVTIVRAPTGTWSVSVPGTSPPVAFDAPIAATASILVNVTHAGTIQATAGGETLRESAIDRVTAGPQPPYVLTFSGDASGSGCEVVWWQVNEPQPLKP